jgi:hypothetical protein
MQRPLQTDRDLTAEDQVTTFNNYYEFGSSKDVKAAAQALKIRPGPSPSTAWWRTDHHRHRRSAEGDAAGRAALPSPLRGGLVDGRALERFSAEGAGGFRQAR